MSTPTFASIPDGPEVSGLRALGPQVPHFNLPDSSGLPKGAMCGIVFGAACVVSALLFIGWRFIKRTRAKNPLSLGYMSIANWGPSTTDEKEVEDVSESTLGFSAKPPTYAFENSKSPSLSPSNPSRNRGFSVFYDTVATADPSAV
ncbi:hypothetical protein PLICRDRAFT_174355 [Plicaturopsis crispa FD-325 SS-3]|nr:hypothetical protein PLICRDRAFT_174355 [Plicaturopsis crispa FD-325 SS-3]